LISDERLVESVRDVGCTSSVSRAASATTAAGGRGDTGRSRARSRTSSIQRTGTIFICCETDFGISTRSFRFSSGMSTVRMPPRMAASNFSFSPPIGSTRPRKVISPVIATSARTGMRVSVDTSAVAIAMPALGPSFGVAPSGTCR
jgi:hypothetical protein